jgi:hypothetical protein
LQVQQPEAKTRDKRGGRGATGGGRNSAGGRGFQRPFAVALESPGRGAAAKPRSFTIGRTSGPLEKQPRHYFSRIVKFFDIQYFFNQKARHEVSTILDHQA